MDKNEFLSTGLLELYALGLTSPEESKEVERYLDAYPELRVELAQMQKSIGNYADSVTPKPKVNQNLSINKWLVYGLFAFSLMLSGWFYITQKKLNHQEEMLQKIKMAYKDCSQELEVLQQNENIFAFFTHPKTNTLRLSDQSNAEMMFYYNPSLRQVFCRPVNLINTNENYQFQVWADIDGKMVSIGLLENGNDHLQSLQYKNNMESINITLEPKGGSEHPTLSRFIGNVNI